MTPDVRIRFVTALVLVLVFGAGVSVGLVADRMLPVTVASEPTDEVAREATEAEKERDKTEGREETREASEPRTPHERILDRIGLGVEQQAHVDSVLDYFQVRMYEFQKEYRPRYWSLVDESRAAISEVLRPDQAAKYDSLLKESDRRRGRAGTAGARP